MLPLLMRCTSDEVVEDVKFSFSRRDSCDIVSLEVIMKGFDAGKFAPI